MSCQNSYSETVNDDINIVIIAQPQYAPYIRIENGEEFCFSYNMIIKNKGQQQIKLISRRWKITDENNESRYISGEGVIGQQPIIQPQQQYKYTSYVDFATPIGFMEGAYTMEFKEGVHIEIPINVFTFAIPFAYH